ncbi:MAG: DUF2184 domain-containing protein [Acetobacteraceae bacterium]
MYSSRLDLADSTAMSTPAIIRARTRDNFMTFDTATVDSTGAFMRSELDRLDNRAYEPLVSVTWGRDIDLRSDVSVADESASFLNSTFASAGGVEPGGKAWIGKDTNAITGVALDIGRTIQPLHLWGMELSYTLPELATAARLNRPVDVDKYNAIMLKYQMDVDEQVYIGDAKIAAVGLLNNTAITTTNVVAGVGGSPWALKTAAEILADVNTLITTAWTASGWSFAPTHLLVPPVQFGRLVSTIVSQAGANSVMEFLKVNSLANSLNGSPLVIAPVKWLTGRGVGGLDRMVCYRKDEAMVRFPMTSLQRTQLENRSLYQLTTYWGRLGQVEFPRPESLAYMDGI